MRAVLPRQGTLLLRRQWEAAVRRVYQEGYGVRPSYWCVAVSVFFGFLLTYIPHRRDDSWTFRLSGASYPKACHRGLPSGVNFYSLTAVG